jgi:hypothetical protein
MVAKQHTARRAHARKKDPVAACTESPTSAAPVLDAALLSDRLCDLLHSLSHSLSVLIVSVEALRRQDADADSDIAAVLQQNVGDKLDIDIEQLMELIEIVERCKAADHTAARVDSAKAV